MSGGKTVAKRLQKLTPQIAKSQNNAQGKLYSVIAS